MRLLKVNAKSLTVQFIDATDFMERMGQNTGGTRAKTLLQSPVDGSNWFFKCSEYKPATESKAAKYYKYEFWSEVIAGELGCLLGIDVLRYYPAVFRHANGLKIGCISPHMIASDMDNTKLTEIGRYMSRYDHSFLPDDKANRKKYTFQLLESTIKKFGLEEFWPHFFTTLIFDALIGNTDRHQENWAFLERNIRVDLGDKDNPFEIDVGVVIKMAPIYDNGSSLGRELEDNRVGILLENAGQLDWYVNNGRSELHWDNVKITHFELIRHLLNTSYAGQVREVALFLDNWDEQEVENMINLADRSLPEEWHGYRIPEARKSLIIKILTLRAQKLRKLFS